MKVEKEDLENRLVQLTVEIPSDRVQSAMRSAARRLSKQTRIPGFRPGKAPYEMILNRFGEDTVFDEALDELGQESYRQALEESEIEPFAPGTLEEIVTREPLILRYTVPLAPEIGLAAYEKIRVPYQEPEITDEDLEESMEQLRQSRALIEPADRPAEMGDVVIVDVYAELRNPEQDEQATIVDMKAVEILIEEQADWPIPGVSEHLVGLEAEAEREFEYTFPEDYSVERLQEKTADFRIKCIEVKSRFVPEWSDDLAQSVGEANDLLDLRTKVRESLQENAIREAEAGHARKVIDELVEGAQISYPAMLLDEEIESMRKDMGRRLASQNLSLEDYLKIEGKTLEELNEELKPDAEDRLARALVLGKLVELEGLDVDEQQIDEEIDRMLLPFEEQAGELRKAFDHPQGRHRIRLDLLTDKAIKRMASIAKGEGGQDREQEQVLQETEIAAKTEEKE